MDTEVLKKQTIEILSLLEKANRSTDRNDLIEKLLRIKQVLNAIEKNKIDCYMGMD